MGWRAWTWGVGLLGLAWTTTAVAIVPPWTRTETREACLRSEGLRRPLFGDLHVHTSYSHDARLWATLVTPRDAYGYARGQAVVLANPDGVPGRSTRIARWLDFAAVTDHAEFFGETRLCTEPGSAAFEEELCVDMRDVLDPASEIAQFITWGFPLGLSDPPPGQPICELPGVDCDGAAVSAWGDLQAAAEEAYDRSQACGFTTLIGYEHTASPAGSHLHRNVLFRNDRVPAVATSHLETGEGGAAQPLWAALERDCVDAGTGCDALTIPHNSNLSGGLRWPDPRDAADARRRQRREPLVEIFQHKAGSECRFDRLAGRGSDTSDPRCTFEVDPRDRQGPFPLLGIDDYPRRNLVRNVLKDGLALADGLGVNPFRLGFVASTDSHNGTPGAVDEDGWTGAQGFSDASDVGRLGDEPFDASRARFNPGGLAVVWAEENARDAIFAALARRETYATSGTRPTVRFFAGRLSGRACERADLIERGYRDGVPMGGELGPVRGTRSPRFVVLALKDAGTTERPGADLERIQIVKGWADADGRVHERVWDAAGGGAADVAVDPATCEAAAPGPAELCTVWEDPDFDPTQRAFYYARVLENPTCRWTTRVCRAAGVDPLAGDCAAMAAAKGEPWSVCCLGPADDAFMEPVIQERAWTSPIWYRPDGVARVTGAIRLGRPGRLGAVKLALRLGTVPGGTLDPSAAPVTLLVRGGALEWQAALPSDGWRATRRGWTLTAAVAGVESATIRVRRAGGVLLKVRSSGLELGAVPEQDAMVRVVLGQGSWEAEHERLWRWARRRLRPRG